MVKMNFEGQGIEIYTSTEVVSIERINDKLEVIAKSGNDEVVLSGDKVLISVGRKAVTEGLNLESIGVRLNRKELK